MNALTRFFRTYLIADAAPLSSGERWRSALAGLLGLLLLQALLTVIPASPATRQLLAPAGASAVILFCLPHSPLGQPWSVAGGLLISSAIGLACGHWIGVTWLAVALAVALSIWCMAALRCLHPPGGAIAIGMASLHATNAHSLITAAANVLGLLMGAMVINNLLRGRRYPQCSTAPKKNDELEPLPRVGIGHQDLDYALGRIDSFLDISETDLVQVYNLATESAFRRHSTLTCGDLMTRDVVTAEFATELDEAWRLLRGHHVKALPVVDRARRIIGLLTLDNFLAHVPDGGAPVTRRIREFLQETPGVHSRKPEVAGQIMSERILVARASDDLSQVAHLLSQRSHQHAIPVVDGEDRLVGILSQTDILAALYHRVAMDRAQDSVAALGQPA